MGMCRSDPLTTVEGDVMGASPPGGTIVADDGRFHLERVSAAGSTEVAFLRRRCYHGVTTPQGYACIGAVERVAQGHWLARVDVRAGSAPLKDQPVQVLGVYATEMDALMALWARRCSAWCRHAEGDG